ncbi:MAG TPA: DNA polymerase I, partial [Acidobacteriota bacterium]|nr:DNA polymerase I [Acidobacteriota bacterium]
AIQAWLAESSPKRFHGLKRFALEYELPVGFEGHVDDAELIHYLLWPQIEDHSLERIALELSRSVPPATEDESLLVEPLATRLEVIHAACAEWLPRLQAAGLETIYREVELPLLPILAGMERTGILIDVPWLETLAAELAGRIARLEKEIYALAGEEFNINSPKQLGEILFDKLQLPSSKKTKKTKSYSTGVEVLESLAPLYPLPARILDYRQLTKLKSTYVDALPPLVNPVTGRLHTTFNQTVAATGRLSSTNPNLQNIPIRTEEGQKIRRAFVAPPGWRLVSADYSQIELRIMAHLSGDELLLAAFRSGQDVHTQTARDVFGAAAEANPAEYRRRAKIINYSILYGKSDFGLAQDLKIPQREAKAFIQSYFATYPGVRRWLDENLADAAASGAVRTMFGRIRPIPELRHSNWNVRSTGERIAANSPIQGAAADIIKLAMIRLVRRLEGSGLQARLLLQVHDELLLECPAEEVDRLRGILREAMEDVVPLKVPLVVDIHDGANWLEAK